MTTAVVGAGPVGMVLAHALAAKGEDVLLVDPDPGPAADGSWRRHGVMQFHHPHFFRPFVRQVLERHAPPMWDAVLNAGCVVNAAPDGMPPTMTTVAARRSVVEAALRRGLDSPQITHVVDSAERVLVEGDRVVGIAFSSGSREVDRLIVATGRTSRFADDLRSPGELVPCGQSYVSRMYRARPGVEPLCSYTPLGSQYDGYLTIAFPQDAGTLSALIVRPSDDAQWAPLWRNDAFEAAAAMIPGLAPWTDQERFEPITDVMRGGTLVNSYRSQAGSPAGVFFAGDAVCATNPAAGRGVSLGLLQASALLGALEEHADPRDAGAAFDHWCSEQIRPWYDDHVADDAYTQQRYAGLPLDVEGPLPGDVVVSALEADPSLAGIVFPYLAMLAPPAALAAAEPRVRALLRDGWRPQPQAGPTRDELIERISLTPA